MQYKQPNISSFTSLDLSECRKPAVSHPEGLGATGCLACCNMLLINSPSFIVFQNWKSSTRVHKYSVVLGPGGSAVPQTPWRCPRNDHGNGVTLQESWLDPLRGRLWKANESAAVTRHLGALSEGVK